MYVRSLESWSPEVGPRSPVSGRQHVPDDFSDLWEGENRLGHFRPFKKSPPKCTGIPIQSVINNKLCDKNIDHRLIV